MLRIAFTLLLAAATATAHAATATTGVAFVHGTGSQTDAYNDYWQPTMVNTVKNGLVNKNNYVVINCDFNQYMWDSRAAGCLAGVLYGLDGIALDDRPTRERKITNVQVVHGIPCSDGTQTMIDLAARVDDLVWEQALESALRKRLTTIPAVFASLPLLGARRTPGTPRIRRVLALRPEGAPPTESLLETLMVQLARNVPGLGPPTRQLEIYNEHGEFVARLDLSWPEIGLFAELDGQQHKDQPVYDARRETAVVAATGWLPGRFTWHEVTRIPRQTERRLAALARQAARRN